MTPLLGQVLTLCLLSVRESPKSAQTLQGDDGNYLLIYGEFQSFNEQYDPLIFWATQ